MFVKLFIYLPASLLKLSNKLMHFYTCVIIELSHTTSLISLKKKRLSFQKSMPKKLMHKDGLSHDGQCLKGHYRGG